MNVIRRLFHNIYIKIINIVLYWILQILNQFSKYNWNIVESGVKHH